MRWDNLLQDQPEVETAKLPLFAEEALVRRFNTPEFKGMTFYEVRAKSIINHVKPNNMGFNWTINPYRGCSHSCVYCLEGDTPILMADGTWKPLATLEAGDSIVGTTQHGGERRYCATKVLAHWKTRRDAFRLTLADGRALVSSGDHRFLTGSGWRRVAGLEDDGPSLRPGDQLAGHSPKTDVIDLEDALVGNSPLGTVESLEALELEIPMYDITTGTGDFIANGVVSHNCFARPTHTYLDMNAGVDFETKIVVKTNAVELLRRELGRPSWAGEHIAMGTNTDNYQRAEGRYQLMRGILTELNAIRNPYSILTKSTLIQRDLDLLVEGAAGAQVSASFSVGTVDEEVWRKTEPGTPHPMKRLEVLRKLNEAGVPCGILMAPILPGISDSPEQLKATVKAAVAAGATHITPIVLHLRKGVKEEFMPWLEETYPELTGEYQRIYTGPNAPKAVAEPIQKSVADLRRRYGARQETNHRSNERAQPTKPEAPVEEQLSFDLGNETRRPRRYRLTQDRKGS